MIHSALSGIEAAARQLDTSASRVARASQPGEDVDLASEMVSMQQAKLQTEASVKVARTGDETIGTLIDMFA